MIYKCKTVLIAQAQIKWIKGTPICGAAVHIYMSKSNLSHTICLMELVEVLDEDGCICAMRLLQKELGCDNLNQIVNKVIMKCAKNLTKTSFIKIENAIKDQYSRRCAISSKSISANKHNNNNNCNHQNKNTREKIVFPLGRLPIDIITKTSST